MSYSTLEITRAGQIAHLWLNRIDVRNAFSDVMIGELDDAFAALGADAAIRAIVLAARGAVFSAGADLNWMRRMAGYSHDENRADAEKLARMLYRIYRCPKPTIARVHGDCYAGGLGLVAACDMAVAADSVTFCLTEVRIGLIPATIGPYVIRAIGERQASRYFLTAEKFSAQTARTLGLVHEVAAVDALDAVLAELTTQLLQASPAALAESKRLIREMGATAIGEATILDTAARIADARSSTEAREGIAAFLERRKPAWIVSTSGAKPK